MIFLCLPCWNFFILLVHICLDINPIVHRRTNCSIFFQMNNLSDSNLCQIFSYLRHWCNVLNRYKTSTYYSDNLYQPMTIEDQMIDEVEYSELSSKSQVTRMNSFRFACSHWNRLAQKKESGLHTTLTLLNWTSLYGQYNSEVIHQLVGDPSSPFIHTLYIEFEHWRFHKHDLNAIVSIISSLVHPHRIPNLVFEPDQETVKVLRRPHPKVAQDDMFQTFVTQTRGSRTVQLKRSPHVGSSEYRYSRTSWGESKIRLECMLPKTINATIDIIGTCTTCEQVKILDICLFQVCVRGNVCHDCRVYVINSSDIITLPDSRKIHASCAPDYIKTGGQHTSTIHCCNMCLDRIQQEKDAANHRDSFFTSSIFRSIY